jgi:hypothetical protein
MRLYEYQNSGANELWIGALQMNGVDIWKFYSFDPPVWIAFAPVFAKQILEAIDCQKCLQPRVLICLPDEESDVGVVRFVS